MNLDAAWAIGQAAMFSTMGVPAVVTRPSPDDTPVAAQAIWLTPKVERDPYGTDRGNRDPRKCLALQRSTSLPSAPAGTRITAPEVQGGADKQWRVEGYAEPMTRDEMRLIVLERV